MRNFKIIERKVIEKEIEIKAENEEKAFDLYLEIKEKTDIMDMNNSYGKSLKYETTIEESDDKEIKEDIQEDNDEIEDDLFFEEIEEIFKNTIE